MAWHERRGNMGDWDKHDSGVRLETNYLPYPLRSGYLVALPSDIYFAMSL